MPYEIEFYEDGSGTKPCLEWIRGLEVRKRRVLGTGLREILQRQGIGVCGSPFGKQLGGGLFEFRLREENVLLRVFCHAHGSMIVLLLSGYGPSCWPATPPRLPTPLTVMWASALREEGVKVNSADPGYVATDLNHHSGNSTVEQGAEIIVTLATSRRRRPHRHLPGSGRRPGQFSIQAINRPGPFSWTGLHIQALLLAIIKTGR